MNTMDNLGITFHAIDIFAANDIGIRQASYIIAIIYVKTVVRKFLVGADGQNK